MKDCFSLGQIPTFILMLLMFLLGFFLGNFAKEKED